MKGVNTVLLRLIAIVLVFCSFRSLGQPLSPGPIDIYSIALVEAAREMERQWGQLSVNQNQVPTDYRNLVVFKDESVRAEYPAAYGDRRFAYLTGTELRARRKALGRDFAALTVHPAAVDGRRIKVVVSQDWISLKRGNLAVSVSDWGTVFFRIDPGTNEFRFDEVKLNGI